MFDYIYDDYLFYIFHYSFFISIGIFCTYVIYRMVYGDNKIARGFLFFWILSMLFAVFHPNFVPYGGGPHYNCNGRIESEAQNIAAAISDYFAVPTRTQVPSYSDLVKSGNYPSKNNYPLQNIDLKRRDKLFKESEFTIDILGNYDEITIVLSAKAGKCPFYRWKCPRPILGKIYVLRMDGSGSNGWLNGYEDINRHTAAKLIPQL